MAIRPFLCSIPALLPLLLLASPASARAAGAYEVKSPSGNFHVSFELKSLPNLAGERATYRVAYRGQPILADSPLGLDFLKAPALDHDFEVVGTQRDSHDSTWQNRFGAKLVVRDHYNQLTVSLRERQSPQRRVDLIFRAYDEGVAFRYFLPEQAALKDFTLTSENTGFYFARDTRAFALDIHSYTGPYEARYSEIGLDQIKPASTIPLPLLMHLSGGPWVALLEADLTDYAGMYVGSVNGIPNSLTTKLSPLPGRLDEAVIGSTPKATPWRVLMVNDQPGPLIESGDLVLNLNPPCALADTAWIEPGKVTFPWWSGFWGGNGAFEHNVNTAMFKHYIDFAARSGIRYIEISDWWYKSPPEVELPENYPEGKVDITQPSDKVDVTHLIDYARQKGVKCILWMDWAAINRQMDAAIPLYEKWGAAGMKIDFMNRDDQKIVNFYSRVAKLAA
jgi:alpha-glucosidase